MADNTEVRTNAAEEVAYKLYQDVIGAEDYPHRKMQPADARAYLLNTFVDCVRAVRGFRPT